MKSLTALFKNSISTCFLLFLSIVSYGQLLHNFTRVQQNDGLIMRRSHGVGEEPGVCVMNFHSDDTTALSHPDYIYMRATAKTDTLNPNNLILTDKGMLVIGEVEDCARFTLPSLEDSTEDIEDVKLYVNGKIAVRDGNATNLIVSDERFKKNITPLENSLEVIRQSNFVEFQYNNLSGINPSKKYYGILAQEMEKVLPTTVTKTVRKMQPTDKKETEVFLFNPNDLIYSGLNAIKELDEENQELKDRVAELEAEAENSKQLEQRVEELEEILMQLLGEKEVNKTNDFAPRSEGQLPSYLSQNQPNPMRGITNIEYRLPDNTHSAHILIQGMNGQVITKIDLQNLHTGKVTFDAQQYGISNGTYVYTLVANEIIIESKKMIFVE